MARKRNRAPLPLYPIAAGTPEHLIPALLSRQGKIRRAPVPRPPAGTYDPSLDAQMDAANRGFRDFRQDTELAGSRAEQDYRFGQEDINRDAGRGLEDLSTRRSDATQDYLLSLGDATRGRDRGLADILRDRARGTEDYGLSRGRLGEDFSTGTARLGEDRDRALEALGRNYRILGGQQTQTAQAAGVARGGALAQAAAKRQENQAFERQPIDTSFTRGTEDLTRNFTRQTSDLDRTFSRFGEDSSQAETRLGEDFSRQVQGLNIGAERTGRDIGTATTRLTQDQGTALGRLGVGFQRGATDRSTALSRAGRENRAFGQDIGAARFYQARGSVGKLPRYKPQQHRTDDPYSKDNRVKLPDWMRKRRI